MECPLCSGCAVPFFNSKTMAYLQCTRCHGVFVHPDNLPSPAHEQTRYLEHNNDVADPGYQAFVTPLVQAVLGDCPPGSEGLDYGAGTGPVASHLLTDAGMSMTLYDPFFWAHPDVLNRTYDFIICCEVMEHFHRPREEFLRLRSLLRPGGTLYCMTDLYREELHFKSWYYKDDPTHVFFYHLDSLTWIREHLHFRSLNLNGRLVRLGTMDPQT